MHIFFNVTNHVINIIDLPQCPYFLSTIGKRTYIKNTEDLNIREHSNFL